ncbi:MAG: thymidine phosphorylase [Litorilinea sp.]|nr:MAG: thymidine phosphorylase [Litorilinea sp.]
MNAVDIIVKKRDGEELTAEEIQFFVDGFVRGEIPDYQVAAWAMAVYFQGMTEAETTALTLAMAASGDQLDLHTSLPPGTVIVDKHSSGGVGDKTTLAVAPIVAACGLPVAKMSGRGLSYTGGTIDKLESFHGWTPDLDEERFRRQLQEIGLVIAGQTANLAPADKILYALRDVTGTVPSLPLIASSIMSKKLAAGADAIVLDVKCGRGAFMETVEDASRLAELMVAIGTRAGRRMTALITQMDQPLGRAVGNALEVKEAIATLQGQGPADFAALVEQVAVEMLRLARPTAAPADLQAQVRQTVESGAALAKFRAFVAAQGGDPAQVDEPDRLPQAPVVQPVPASASGYVQAIDPRAIGLTVVDLGGGRHRKGDPIDHRVGVVLQVKVGDSVEAGQPLALVHAADAEAASQAVQRVLAAFEVGQEAVAPLPLIHGRIGPTSPSDDVR